MSSYSCPKVREVFDREFPMELAIVAPGAAKPGSYNPSTELWPLIASGFTEEHVQQFETSHPAFSASVDAATHICTERLMELSEFHYQNHPRELVPFLRTLTSLPTSTLAKFDSQKIQQTLIAFCVDKLPQPPIHRQMASYDKIFALCGKLHLRLHEANGTSPASAVTPWDAYDHQRFAALPTDAQARVLRDLLQASPTRDRKHSLLQVKLCLKHTRNISDDGSSELRDVLKTSFFDLCSEVTATTSPHCCMLSMQCIDHLLRNKRSVIYQEHVEAALNMITTMAGSSAPAFPSDHTRHFFTALCQLSLTLLFSHRPKLSMRYHLIGQILRYLLRCLYTPYSKQRRLLQQPEWLDRTQSRAIADEAELLARMFTMLCNPAPSAVTRSRDELNDKTKKARDIAGQHLQPVLEEMCFLQLVGSITPEARDRLMPGVWAMISSMNIVQMRAMNEGLAGTEMRDVWKAVYGEWDRAKK